MQEQMTIHNSAPTSFFLLPSILQLRDAFSCILIYIEKNQLEVHEGKAQDLSLSQMCIVNDKAITA